MRQSALRGLRRYQMAERPPLPAPHAVHAQAGTAKLLHVFAQQDRSRPPVVLIPSIVNPHYILDLSERRSLARFLGERGHDVWLVDWGRPRTEDASLDLAGHVTERLLPLLAALGRPALLVGYCLGGTLALAAAHHCAPASVATIAAPWDFAAFPETDRSDVAALWTEAKPLCERLGYVPMEVLQSGFWKLDTERTIRKYAGFADVPEGSEAERAFIAVEDWANGGAPLTFAAARELFEALYRDNATGTGAWQVGGTIADPAGLACPTLSIASATDRITPAATAPPLAERTVSGLGHVGMIVGSRAPEEIWVRLSDWMTKWTG